MQFEHPELLWGLFLLIIPILVHLLRLRRFKNTPFTNVKFLRKIQAESNRSSELKRWLLLLTRLGLLTALVLAFCKPFESSYSDGLNKEVIVYLDNSFSMQAQGANASLLQNSIQDMLQFFPEDLRFTLITQTETYRDVVIRDIQRRLLDLQFHPATITAEEVRLRTSAIFSRADSTIREIWILSDFIGWELTDWESWDQGQIHTVVSRTDATANSSVDSAYIGQKSTLNLELLVSLSSGGSSPDKSVSLYNGDTLIAKTTAEERGEGILKARFLLPSEESLNGTIQITDNGLTYDNTLYVTLNRAPKINVLSIGPKPTPYLERIFTSDEFIFAQPDLRTLDYGFLETQHLVLLNELEEFPEALIRPLQEFVQQGGSLVIIPSFNFKTENYGRLLQPFGTGLGQRVEGENLITEINFDHPLFRDVFEKPVANFEYPGSVATFPILGNPEILLGYQNGMAFLAGWEGLYLFSAPLGGEYSNFRRSSLIVPSLYSIAKASLPGAELYYQIGQENSLDLDIRLQQDEIVQLRGRDYSFIPRQQSFSQKTRLFLRDQPVVAGNYRVENRGEFIQNTSFNYVRSESEQSDVPLNLPGEIITYPDIESLVANYQNSMEITSLWKWFVILAVLFVLVEIILQKTMR